MEDQCVTMNLLLLKPVCSFIYGVSDRMLDKILKHIPKGTPIFFTIISFPSEIGNRWWAHMMLDVTVYLVVITVPNQLIIYICILTID